MTESSYRPEGAGSADPREGRSAFEGGATGTDARSAYANAYGDSPEPPYPRAAGGPYAAQPRPYPQPPRKRRTSPWPVVAVIALIILMVVILSMVGSCNATLQSIANSAGMGETASTTDRSPHIGVITMNSTIQYDGSECSPTGLKSLLDRAEKDDSVKGVVLFMDSGGGTATAGEEMAAYVRDFDKPIVVASGATNASAAYEISSQADSIFVAKTTSIGSIGVAMQVTDLSGLYDMLGIDIETIKSSDSKDSTYGNRPLTEDEKQWYQAMVDQIEADFIATVAQGRDMEAAEVEALANGLTYTGIDAVANGLADEIGYLGDAVAEASALAGYDHKLPSSALELPASNRLESMLGLLGESMGSSIGRSMQDAATDADAVRRIG